MKASDIRGLSPEDLETRENEIRDELFNLKLQVVTQQTTNVSRLKLLRRDLARVLTVKKEKELEPKGD